MNGTGPHAATPALASSDGVLFVSAAGLLRAPQPERSGWVAQAPRWLMVADPGLPVAALRAALMNWPRTSAATTRVVLQTRRTHVSDLAALCKAGVDAIEWHVPLLADDDARWSALRDAASAVSELGLDVHLRSAVRRADLAILATLRAPSRADLRIARWVLEPSEQAEAAVAPAALQAHWPSPRTTPWQLVRSLQWPACIELPADATEPLRGSIAARTGIEQLPACASCTCMATQQCRGMSAPLVAAWQQEPSAWRPWQPAAARHPEPDARRGSLAYSSRCIEVRGLRLGLRQAWRLRLAHQDLASFCDHAQADGWHVAASPAPVSMAIGGRVEDGGALDETGHLVVVAVEAGLAQACLQAELDMLGVDPADLRAAVVAMVERHRFLGAAYGFPPCCVEAFCDAFVEVVHTDRMGDNALAWARAAARSRRFLAPLATLAGGLGHSNVSPLRHLPCRFDCAASVALATRLLDDQRALSGPSTADATCIARPALVGPDGTFAWLDGRWDSASGAVVEIVAIECHGFTTGAAEPWQRALAGPRTWTSLRCDPSGIAVCDPAAAASWQPIAPPLHHRGMVFPLLLPFEAA